MTVGIGKGLDKAPTTWYRGNPSRQTRLEAIMERHKPNTVYVLVVRGMVEYSTIYRQDMAETIRDYWGFGYASAEMKIKHLQL